MSGNNEEQDCKCYAESRTQKACPPLRNVTHPLRYYEFTPDEIKALEECDKESFYRRCLPFSSLFATAAYAAIKYGYLSRNRHFGAVPKVLIAAFVGYMYGRITYIPVCEQKLRTMPGHLGNIMRTYHQQRNTPPDPKKC